MPIVCGVRFRGGCKVYYFSPGSVDEILANDQVIVETSRGRELGEIALPLQQVSDDRIVGKLKPIVRVATAADLLESQRFRRQEDEAVGVCREQVVEHSLPMKIVSAEYSFDGTRLTFFFTSEKRVDFRGLVRELARVFKTRIELRQIGVRDESKIIGGLGKCGRALCCATWLTEFSPVSIRMAKQQDLPLSPMEISGLCGRLLCCLRYENDYYRRVKGKFPRTGRILKTPAGPGKVIKVSVLREMVRILLEDGGTIDVTADQISGDTGIDAPTPEELAAEGTAAISAMLDTAIDRRKPETRQSPNSAQPAASGGGSQSEGGTPRGRAQQRENSKRSSAGRSRRRSRGRRSRRGADAGSEPRQASREAAASADAPSGESRPAQSQKPSDQDVRKSPPSDGPESTRTAGRDRSSRRRRRPRPRPERTSESGEG